MTEQHRAKPEEWAAVERLCKNGIDTLNCLLELRDRVEALEAAAKPVEPMTNNQTPSKNELFQVLLQSGGATKCVSIEWLEPFAHAVLERWGK